MELAVCSDTGKVRTLNEDSYCTLVENGRALLAVADGMGGHNAGEVASRIAVEIIFPIFRKEEYSLPMIVEAVQQANAVIKSVASEQLECNGMGTTLTVALVSGQQLMIGHVGDSRLYLIRDWRIEQMTQDHSLVSELVKLGKLTAEEAENHPQRNIITRALGTETEVAVDTSTVELRQGDIVVLCTDGLSSLLNAGEIHDGLCLAESLQCGVNKLVEMANDRGGTDNITVIALRV